MAAVHFDGSLNFLDLFLPNRSLSSFDRAQAFLWHVYYYLESSEGNNPFDDEYSRANARKAPLLRKLTDAQISTENVDTLEEIAWGRKMSAQRNAFLQRLVSSTEYEKNAKASAPHFVSGTLSPVFHPTGCKLTRSGAPEGHRDIRRSRQQRQERESFGDEGAFMYYVPRRDLPLSITQKRGD